MLQIEGMSKKREAKTKLLAKSFEEAERKTGELDRFRYLVEKDQERYAEELRKFKETLREFDRDRRLLPLDEM